MAIWRPSVPRAVGIALGFERHEDADLAEASVDRVVHIGRDHALRRPRASATRRRVMFSPMVAIGVLQAILDGRLRAREVGGLERLDIVPSPISAILAASRDEGLELVVAGDEVGLGVDLEDGGRVAGRLDGDETLGGDAAGLLGGLDRPFLRSQSMAASMSPLRLVERGLAIHHARAGLSRAAPSPSRR